MTDRRRAKRSQKPERATRSRFSWPRRALAVSALALAPMLAGGSVLLTPTEVIAEQTSGHLAVPISRVRSSGGTVFVALYDRANWLKPHRFLRYKRVRAKNGTVVAHFSSVNPGRYSVAVFHDENNNGRVDTNWVGLPKEGFGFSRVTPLRIPSFKETSFELRRRVTQPVKLRY